MLNELVGLGVSVAERRNSCRHCDLRPSTGVGDEVAEVADVLDGPEMTEPDTKLRNGGTDVVVLASNLGKSERKVMREEENVVSHLHFMRECPVVPLILGQFRLGHGREVGDIDGKI